MKWSCPELPKNVQSNHFLTCVGTSPNYIIQTKLSSTTDGNDKSAKISRSPLKRLRYDTIYGRRPLPSKSSTGCTENRFGRCILFHMSVGRYLSNHCNTKQRLVSHFEYTPATGLAFAWQIMANMVSVTNRKYITYVIVWKRGCRGEMSTGCAWCVCVSNATRECGLIVSGCSKGGV